MTFFFFGTLMDREVLTQVLGRAVREAEIVPARVHGFRCVRTAREPYPTLVPAFGGVVDGILLRGVGLRDEARIRHFEHDDYAARWLTVQVEGEGPVAARAFFARAELGATDEPWRLEGWQRAHKAACLEECRAWMETCPE